MLKRGSEWKLSVTFAIYKSHVALSGGEGQEIVMETVGLVIELVADAIATSSPDASSFADPRSDEPTRKFENTRVEIASLTGKLLSLEDARDKAKCGHDELVKNIRTGTKMSGDHVLAEHDGALCRYHGISQSVLGIVNAADGRNASHTETLTHVRLQLQEARKMITISLLAGLSHKGVRVARLKSEIEVEELVLQALPGLAAAKATGRTEASLQRDSIEMLGQKRGV